MSIYSYDRIFVIIVKSRLIPRPSRRNCIAFLCRGAQQFVRVYALLNWATIGSDNGLSPVRRQAIIWTNSGILLIRPLGTNFSEILIGIQSFSSKKLHLKTSSAKRRLFCLGINELTNSIQSPFRKAYHVTLLLLLLLLLLHYYIIACSLCQQVISCSVLCRIYGLWKLQFQCGEIVSSAYMYLWFINTIHQNKGLYRAEKWGNNCNV